MVAGDTEPLKDPHPVTGHGGSLPLNSEEYLGAFLDGFEFVLMAMEGRLATEEAPTDVEDVEAFLADYRRILALHQRHADRGLPAPDVSLEAPFVARLGSDVRN